MSRRAAAALLLTLTFAVTLAAAACGEAADAADPFAGSWQRLAGDAPDEGFTLVVTARGDVYELTFTNAANGRSLTVDGRAEGHELVCTLPTGDGGDAAAPKWAPALPGEVEVALAAGEPGERLEVSLVSRDGGRLPLWAYVRAPD